MSMISWPFDSTVSYDTEGNPVYDRTYSADVLARILRKYFSDGVFSTEDDCLQVLEASGMTVSISPGDCLILGRHGYLETAETLTLDTASASLDRIDLVVLRLDLGVGALNITPAVVTGTAAVTPAVPSLTQNSTVYELALAQVYVGANVTAITQANITDTRLDSTRCGVVASILGDTDTSTYYAQIAADLAEFKAGREADFDAWYATITSILDEDTAANLLSMIDAINTKLSVSGLLKGDGSGGVSAAVEGTDYVGISGAYKANPERTSADLTYHTSSITLGLEQAGMLVQMHSSSTLTVTVPPNSTVAFPIDTEIEVVRWGSGEVNIVAGSGVTIYSADSLLGISTRYASVGLKKVGTDTWLLTGALA